MTYGLIDIARDTFTGDVRYSDEQSKANRISICRTCPNLNASMFDSIGQCGKCGCYISHKVKYQLTTCPDNKW